LVLVVEVAQAQLAEMLVLQELASVVQVYHLQYQVRVLLMQVAEVVPHALQQVVLVALAEVVQALQLDLDLRAL
jgi:hypothetical protein